jgi:hypothetical protein
MELEAAEDLQTLVVMELQVAADQAAEEHLHIHHGDQ